MKRVNTADPEMIRKIAELRKVGIKDFYCEADYYKQNGEHKHLALVTKHTAQGISAYANAMHRKYGDSVTVRVGYFDLNCKWIDYTKYHA